MRWFRHALPRQFRLTLALALMLAGLASARLQGHMAATSPETAAPGLLCSGAPSPNPDNAPGTSSPCLLCCHLPLAGHTNPPVITPPGVILALGAPAQKPDLIDHLPTPARRSRAPPLAV